MRKRVSPRRNSEKPAHRLSGLLYCADCGSRLAYINSKPKDGKLYDSNQAFRCSRYHNKYHSCTGHYIKASTIEMLIYQATKRVSQYVLKDEKEFVEQLKAQYELQCEKDNTDDKKELLEAKRRMMDLDDLIKGLYENFTLGRLPERQFNRLMTEYDTEQSSLEQRISELETATERISTKAVQIDKFVRLVKKYRDFEELTTPISVIDRFQFAVAVDLLSQEGKVGELLFHIPQAFPCTDGGGGNGVAPFHQFLIAADAVFDEKVHSGGRTFQILNGRPPLVSCALLGLDIVLNVNEQTDLPAALPGLSGGPGASGDARDNGFFRVIGAQGFEPGKSFLVRRPGGDILSPLDLVSFPL